MAFGVVPGSSLTESVSGSSGRRAQRQTPPSSLRGTSHFSGSEARRPEVGTPGRVRRSGLRGARVRGAGT